MNRCKICEDGAGIIVVALKAQSTVQQGGSGEIFISHFTKELECPLSAGCRLLTILAWSDMNEETVESCSRRLNILSDNGVLQVLVHDVLKRHSNYKKMTALATGALRNMLYLCPKEVHFFAYKIGLIDVLFSAMTEQKRCAVCLESYIALITHFIHCHTELVQRIRSKVIDSGLLDLVVSAMRTFLGVEDICYQGLGVLINMCSGPPNESFRCIMCGEELEKNIQLAGGETTCRSPNSDHGQRTFLKRRKGPTGKDGHATRCGHGRCNCRL
jgi:hypothetical protein